MRLKTPAVDNEPPHRKAAQYQLLRPPSRNPFLTWIPPRMSKSGAGMTIKRFLTESLRGIFP